ncbi:MAG: M56 family metallopeptidase [Saprospiraceae bacterium]|nr:M56 family metallopeptidase [Saprospiraceae bacterium]
MAIVFLLKLTLFWGVFALLYSLLLRRETFFRANRFYLLGAAILGMLLALPGDWFGRFAEQSGVPAAVLPVVSVGLQQAEAAAAQWTWLDYVWMVYTFGAAIAFFRMAWGIYRLIAMAAQGEKEKLSDGCTIIRSSAAKVPFSFFRWIFIPKDHDEDNVDLSAMLAHERAHVHGRHSTDVLFMETLCIIFWFHPLAHWYRRSLRTIHEYLADAEASERTDKKQYGLLLIRQAQSGMSLAYVNHFFQSPLKQRLIMLTKSASPVLRAWKYGLILPVYTLLLLLVRPSHAQVPDNQAGEKSNAALNPNEIDKMPEYPGGDKELVRFLIENVKYPEAARRDSIEELVPVIFTIDETGAVTDVQTLKPPLVPGGDALAAEAIRVVSSMPKWIPGQKDGKPVKVRFTLPIRFRIE